MIKRNEHLTGRVKEIYQPLVLTGNEAIFGANGNIVAWLLKNIIDEDNMIILEENARKCPLGKPVQNSRGKYEEVTLGCLIESGGTGNIRQHDEKTPEGKKFLRRNNKLLEHLGNIMTSITPIHSYLVDYVPKKLRAAGKFCQCFWNRTPISM